MEEAMHSNTKPNVDLTSEDNMSNTPSWHLVSTHTTQPRVQSVSQKPSLKMKIIRQPVTNQKANNWQAAPEKTAEQQESLIESNYEFEETDSTTEDVDSEDVAPRKRTPWYFLLSEKQPDSTTEDVVSEEAVPKKRTPWYLLPRKPVPETEPQMPVSAVATFKEPIPKHRVANKPKAAVGISPNQLSEELSIKMENLKNKLVYPPRRSKTLVEKAKAQGDKRRTMNHAAEQQDSIPDKIPALNPDNLPVASFSSSKEQVNLPLDFAIAKEARKRAEQLLYCKGIQPKIKSEGFKKPTCSKRLKTSSNIQSTTGLETCVGPKNKSSIDLGNSCEESNKQEELADSRYVEQKPEIGGFKMPTCPKRIYTNNPRIYNSESGLDSNHHNPVQSMSSAAVKQAPKLADKHVDLKSITRVKKSGGFKIPICSKGLAKHSIKNTDNDAPKVRGKIAIGDKSVDFVRAKEARRKAEQLVKSGSIHIVAKTEEEEDLKQSTSSTRPNVVDELLSTDKPSFSSLCEKVEDTNEAWSNCLDQIYASFSKKSCKDQKEVTCETRSLAGNRVNLGTTIFVSSKDISKKFLLTFLTKFGTITAIFIRSRYEAFVVFQVPTAAQRACALIPGVATLGGTAVQVRMAAEEDRYAINRLQYPDGAPGPTGDQHNTSESQRPSVWLNIAAVKNQKLPHTDSRELVTYAYDEMF